MHRLPLEVHALVNDSCGDAMARDGRSPSIAGSSRGATPIAIRRMEGDPDLSRGVFDMFELEAQAWAHVALRRRIVLGSGPNGSAGSARPCRRRSSFEAKYRSAIPPALPTIATKPHQRGR
jgi:hypothetical protein